MGYFRPMRYCSVHQVGFLLAVCIVLITACSTDRHVVTGGLIQKRKYRPGWHMDLDFRNDQPSNTHRSTAIRLMARNSANTRAVIDVFERPLAFAKDREPITASIAPVRPMRTRASMRHQVREVLTPLRKADSALDGEENLMPKKKWNMLAVPVLVLALGTVALAFLVPSTLAVLVAGALTVVLGAISLRHIRSHDEAGKGFALTGFIIALFALLFTGISIAAYGFL